MVTHETYKSPDGAWLAPQEVERQGDRIVMVGTGAPVPLGRGEKMSKSKKNVVDTDDIIAQHGADEVRWFMLYDRTPERKLTWTEAGIDATSSFTNRLSSRFGAVNSTAD